MRTAPTFRGGPTAYCWVHSIVANPLGGSAVARLSSSRPSRTIPPRILKCKRSTKRCCAHLPETPILHFGSPIWSALPNAQAHRVTSPLGLSQKWSSLFQPHCIKILGSGLASRRRVQDPNCRDSLDARQLPTGRVRIGRLPIARALREWRPFRSEAPVRFMRPAAECVRCGAGFLVDGLLDHGFDTERIRDAAPVDYDIRTREALTRPPPLFLRLPDHVGKCAPSVPDSADLPADWLKSAKTAPTGFPSLHNKVKSILTKYLGGSSDPLRKRWHESER